MEKGKSKRENRNEKRTYRRDAEGAEKEKEFTAEVAEGHGGSGELGGETHGCVMLAGPFLRHGRLKAPGHMGEKEETPSSAQVSGVRETDGLRRPFLQRHE
jgi:hypothetical protein